MKHKINNLYFGTLLNNFLNLATVKTILISDWGDRLTLKLWLWFVQPKGGFKYRYLKIFKDIKVSPKYKKSGFYLKVRLRFGDFKRFSKIRLFRKIAVTRFFQLFWGLFFLNTYLHIVLPVSTIFFFIFSHIMFNSPPPFFLGL